MKAILEFDLPTDQYKFDCVRSGEPPFREVLGRPVTIEEAWKENDGDLSVEELRRGETDPTG